MAAIYAIGSNGSGQLGIGHKEDVSVPKPALFDGPTPPHIRAVAAGGNHTLILTRSGQIYWSGDSKSGACGVVPQNPGREPSFAPMLSKEFEHDDAQPVTHVAATWESTIFVRQDKQGKNREAYSCGLGDKGELGQGQFVVRIPSAQRIPDFPPPDTEIVHLSACMSHVVAVLNDGSVYGWGNGRKGQIGSPDEIVHSPRRLDGIDFHVKKAVCGKEFTCLIGEDGQISVLGSDKWGIKSSAPAMVQGWQDIGASWSNIYVLKSDGHVQSWGRDDYSQNVPSDLAKVSNMAVGSEHIVVHLESGEVVAWGWGEHGNCGPIPSKQTTKGVRNTIASSKYIPADAMISTIGAGCATTWIVIESRS